MPAPAVKEAPTADAAPSTMRRFELPDLVRHGKWLLPRLIAKYPHLNERAVASWLSSILYSNDYLFLYQEHGVALAQVMSEHTLSGKPMVYERFVWVEDAKDAEQLKAGAAFYAEFFKWAKMQGADPIVVEEASDIPHELVREQFGKRVFERTQKFVRV